MYNVTGNGASIPQFPHHICMCKYLYSTYIYLHWLFWVRYWWWQQWLQVLMGYTLKKHQLWLHIRFTLGGWDVFLISYNHDHGFSPHKGLLNGLKLHGCVLTVLNDMSLTIVQHFSSGVCFFSITILGLYHSCQKCILTRSGDQYNCYYYICYGYWWSIILSVEDKHDFLD